MSNKENNKKEQTFAGGILFKLLRIFTKQKDKINGVKRIEKNKCWIFSIVLALIFTIFLIFFAPSEGIQYVLLFLLIFLYFIKTYELLGV